MKKVTKTESDEN